MICNTIGQTADSYQSIYVTGGAEVAEIYGSIGYNDLIFLKSQTMTGDAPLMYDSYPGVLTDYTILGNSYQNGVPDPEHPVEVVSVGEKTENLFDKDATDTNNGYVVNKFLTSSGDMNSSSLYSISEYIRVSSSTVYTVFVGNTPESPAICFYDANKNFIEGIAYDNNDTITVTTPANAKYCRVSYATSYNGKIMLNLGSTALPYEPYGYKIPITCGGETNNIYLGQVETTRRIKKLVLTGGENISKDSDIGQSARYYISISDIENGTTNLLSSHFTQSVQYEIGTIRGYRKTIIFSVDKTIYATVADFKAWLAAQYANGTPVTIWYVTAESETGIVNEPLHKIGDYADTIAMEQAGETIPTIAGSNTLSVGTTVQPSSVSITGHIKPTTP